MQIFLLLQIRESPFRDSKFHSILLFQLCSSAIEVYLSRYNLKMRSRATSSTLVRLENFNTSTLAILYWSNYLFGYSTSLWKWKCQSPPWLSRWRVRRVLIHTRRANRKRNKNWLRITNENVTKLLRRDESTLLHSLRSRVQTPLIDGFERTFWERYEIIFRQETETLRWPEVTWNVYTIRQLNYCWKEGMPTLRYVLIYFFISFSYSYLVEYFFV